MPVAVEEAGIDAYDELCENLGDLQTAARGTEDDVQFLRDFLNNPALASLIQAQDTLQDTKEYQPVACDTSEVIKELVDELNQNANNPSASELKELLCNPHIRSLVDAHDDIASKNYEPVVDPFPVYAPAPEVFNQPPSTDAIRMVGIRKNGDEPLGILVEEEKNSGLRISRIMSGSAIERQGDLPIQKLTK